MFLSFLVIIIVNIRLLILELILLILEVFIIGIHPNSLITISFVL